MRFLISLHIDPAVLDALPDEERAAISDGHGEFIAALKESGRRGPAVAVRRRAGQSPALTPATPTRSPRSTAGPRGPGPATVGSEPRRLPDPEMLTGRRRRTAAR